MSVQFARALVTLCGVMMLSACVLINRFDKMDVIVSPSGVVFTLPGKIDQQKIIMRGITVWLDNCERDCVYWEMVRPATAADVEPQVTTLPIYYGVVLSDMQTRIHKPLKSGTYRVTAGLGIVRDSGGTEEVKVIGEFSIK